MARHHPQLINLCQCNCRVFRTKQSTLELHLENISPDTTPSVIALQEPLSPVKHRDYTTFHPSCEAHPNVETLVHRHLAAVLHQLDVPECAHLLHEILPRRRTEASLLSSMCTALPNLLLPLYLSSYTKRFPALAAMP
ncbi:hypothetical protein MRX96_045503 [Rhipicephalus microplus]